jgi:transglutaminase-like putative cysteine protease
MAERDGAELPVPESDDLGRYLEDTITIDWQTPTVMECAQGLLADVTNPEERLRRLFVFVRDEVAHSLDVSPERVTCRASEVLKEGHGLCYAKSHLLAALLRIAGLPSGFAYVRMADAERRGRFVLHGVNAVRWPATAEWIFLDASGRKGGPRTECRLSPPFSLAAWPDPEAGEGFLPFVYRRPGKRVMDLLERAPDFATVIRNLPDAL